MIITITGAFRNAGDHLIVDRALKLLRKYSDKDIININRKHIKETDYRLFNKAKAVILCGGPAYQENIYPEIYNLDLNRITVPVIPLGLGYKQASEKFSFSEKSLDFIRTIHKKIKNSSARDIMTKEVLKEIKINNVIMTGCPAWYNMDKLNKNFTFKKESQINKVAFSVPAKVTADTIKIMKYISERFSEKKLICTFHHGFFTRFDRDGIKTMIGFLKCASYAKKYGFKTEDMNSSSSKFKIYDDVDLHIGYRVHAHIFFLSERKATLLISEDSRAKGQSATLGTPDICGIDTVSALKKEIDAHFHTKGTAIKRAVNKMKKTFPVMKNFLKGI